MSLKFPRFVWLLLLFTSACERQPDTEENTTVFGTVLDNETGSPLANASILKISACADLPVNDTVLVAQTDENGKFELTISLSHSGTSTQSCYENLLATYPNYSYAQFNIKRGAINQSTARLERNFYLRAHIKNISPFDSNDSFTLQVENNTPWSPIYWVFANAYSLDTVIYIAYPPNILHGVHWYYDKNGATTHVYETFQTTPGDTLYRNFHF